MENQNVKKNAGQDIAITQIKADRFDAIISENNYTIIDVRSPKGIETQGAIPGARNIPFESIEHAIDSRHKDYHHIFHSEGPFLFCCTGGVMSYAAAIKAQQKGIKNVYNLEGGHAAWLQHSKLVGISSLAVQASH